MVPYSEKIIQVVRNMQIKPSIAKSPTTQSSLNTPTISELVTVEGNIKLSEVSYRISAFNEYGETVASEEKNVVIGEQLDPITIFKDKYTAGILERGVYYYVVSAVNENGETNVQDVYAVRAAGAPSPDWSAQSSTVTNGDGLLPQGTNFYAVTAVFGNKETSLSSFLEVKIPQENSTATIHFLAVEGATKYKVYGRSREMPKLIATIEAGTYTGPEQVYSYRDNGSTITEESAPAYNTAPCGIEIFWNSPDNSEIKAFKIYGRLSPEASNLQLIASIPFRAGQTTYSYKDTGYQQPQGESPKRENTTGYSNGAGVRITWRAIPGATGYKIYGREKTKPAHPTGTTEHKGLVATIGDGTITSWTDTGILNPDYTVKHPVADTTDGTKGRLGAVIPDGETLVVDESGKLSVKGGIDSFLGRSDITTPVDQDVLIYNAKQSKFTNLNLRDLVFLFITMSDGKVVPIDQKFEDFKTDLVNKLATISSFTEKADQILAEIKLLKNRIDFIDKEIGTSFSPELQNNINKAKSSLASLEESLSRG